ncbi:MAG: HNH endonuclease [Mesorhizobium sp.]|nr:MAG: HNH endonuclease [Mesorhizobium sp.]RWN73169.1 MAG: HNH endonuclease [Mesorhizobium sp.]RWN85177.1 MAG: HNH endonuclease [Mesorhizobium sp.]
MTDIDQMAGQLDGRVCTSCDQWKPRDQFGIKRRSNDGMNNECKECAKLRNKEYYANCDKAARYEKQKARRDDNPDQRKMWDANYREQNPDRIKEAQKRHYSNPDNKRKRAAYVRAWAAANPEKVREKTRKSQAKRNKNPDVRLHNAVGRAIREALGKGGKARRKTFSIVGYTLDDLKSHIGNQFLPGMTWENYGDWHIDHKIPKVLFNFQTVHDIDFKRCWDLENLQPLWAAENKKKKDRFDAPFQPSLALGLSHPPQGKC